MGLQLQSALAHEKRQIMVQPQFVSHSFSKPSFFHETPFGLGFSVAPSTAVEPGCVCRPNLTGKFCDNVSLDFLHLKCVFPAGGGLTAALRYPSSLSPYPRPPPFPACLCGFTAGQLRRESTRTQRRRNPATEASRLSLRRQLQRCGRVEDEKLFALYANIILLYHTYLPQKAKMGCSCDTLS